MMITNIRYCSVCNKTMDNIKNMEMSKEEKNFYKGYLIIWDRPYDKICPCCKKGFPVSTNISSNDFNIIKDVSNYDRQFLEAMIDLKKNDPIEYQLKMSQFKANLKQQESSKLKEEDNNTPHCPYCNSTNIKKITTGSKVAHTALFGIFSMSRNSKQWHCNNCKSDF